MPVPGPPPKLLPTTATTLPSSDICRRYQFSNTGHIAAEINDAQRPGQTAIGGAIDVPVLGGGHDNHAVGRGSFERELSTERHGPVSGTALPINVPATQFCPRCWRHRGGRSGPRRLCAAHCRETVTDSNGCAVRLTPGLVLVIAVQCRAAVDRHVQATPILDRHDAVAAGAHVTGDPGRAAARLSPAVQVAPPSTEVWRLPPTPLRRPIRLRLRWTTTSARVSGAGFAESSSLRAARFQPCRSSARSGPLLGNLPVIRACARHADRLARLNLGRGGEGDDHGAGRRRSHLVRGVRQSLLCKPCDRYRSRAQAPGRRRRQVAGGGGAGAGAGGQARGAGASTPPPLRRRRR